MLSLLNINGLIAYTEKDILIRNFIKNYITLEVKKILTNQNKAWQFFELEASALIPNELINKEYATASYFQVNETLSLKPETTATSYLYAKDLLLTNNKPPLCVYQTSKSFRKEQDQTLKHMRFKEFYQLEFQCIYSTTTKNDYQESVIESLASLLRDILKLNTRIVLSDRLPNYSLKTLDLEVFNGDKWMEICSVSLRNDFSENHLVLEIAFGLDRLLFNFNSAIEVFNINTTKEY